MDSTNFTETTSSPKLELGRETVNRETVNRETVNLEGVFEKYEYGNRARREKKSCINFDRILSIFLNESKFQAIDSGIDDIDDKKYNKNNSKENESELKLFNRWKPEARNLFCYIFQCIYYDIVLKNIEQYAKQLRDFKDKKIKDEFHTLNYYEKRDAVSKKLGIEMLQPVLFTVGFQKVDEILENILKRMEEFDSLEQFREKSSCTRLRLNRMYECHFPINDVARDLRVVGIKYGFTIIHYQLPIVIAMFLEFVILDFLKQLQDLKLKKKPFQKIQGVLKRTGKVSIEDIMECNELFFTREIKDNIIIDESVFTQCMFSVPKSHVQVDSVEKINNFPLPQLKHRKKLPKYIG